MMMREQRAKEPSGNAGGDGGSVEMPGWLGGLVEEKFFVECEVHENRKKNEKNIFCLDCCASICSHCAPHHHSHPVLQVRRYVYNDVVRLDDLEKLIDCSYVQPYTTNSAKVIVLKPRPQTRPFKGYGNICLSCDRILQEPFHFCCLSCKVDYVMMQGDDLSTILFPFDGSDFVLPCFENLRMDASVYSDNTNQMTSNSMLEDTMHFEGSSSGPGSTSMSSSRQTEKPQAPKPKKGGGAGRGGGFFPQMVLSLSRRKGAPHRSPLS